MKSLVEFINENKKFPYTYKSWKDVFDHIFDNEEWEVIKREINDSGLVRDENNDILSIPDVKKLYDDTKTEIKLSGELDSEEDIQVQYKNKIYILHIEE